MLRIDVITIFPELFEPFRRVGVLGAAVQAGRVRLTAHDLRAFSRDRRRNVDDAPYGGGPGMVMTPGPLVEAIETLAGPKGPGRSARVVLLSPQGRPFSSHAARSFAELEHLVLVCGRYEGVDQRAIDIAVDEELSIGDYVLSGGEAPALVVVEALCRFVPGVLGNPESLLSESFEDELLEGPQYTRPATYRGLDAPQVLRSGDHARISDWRRRQALDKTRERRPDLSGRQGEP